MKAKQIYVAVPGGVRSVGGMCRMAAYYTAEWQDRQRQPALVIVDSSGPYVKWRMPAHFAAAFFRILIAGLSGRIALLHLHMAEYGSALRKGILLYLAKCLGIPVVVHLHSAEFVEFCEWLPPWGLRLLTRMLGRADRIVALGSSWERYLIDTLHLPADRVTILRNAVPSPAGYPAAKPPRADCRLLFLGAVGPRKGMDELLPALTGPALASLPWHIEIAGNGDIQHYKSYADALGLGTRVTFYGWTDAETTKRLLVSSDVLVLPSHNEGLPMAIIEAMANGLAVIATPVGAVADAVADGVTGILVPPRDTSSLSEALRRVIADPDLRSRLGQAGRKRFLEEFELTAFNDRLEPLLTALISRNETNNRIRI